MILHRMILFLEVLPFLAYLHPLKLLHPVLILLALRRLQALTYQRHSLNHQFGSTHRNLLKEIQELHLSKLMARSGSLISKRLHSLFDFLFDHQQSCPCKLRSKLRLLLHYPGNIGPGLVCLLNLLLPLLLLLYSLLQYL